MNSKQINFFTVPQDICDISTFVKEQQCKIVKGKLEYPLTEYDIQANEEMIFQVYLLRDFMPFGDSTKIIDAKDEIDIFSNPCIEFGIGGFYPYSDKVLHRSRFYFISEYYENDLLLKKNIEFIKWANDFLKKFRKKFLQKSFEFQGLLFTKNCLEWVKTNNATLSGGGMKFIIE